MKLHAPSYYASFACLCGDCPDTCCSSWEVVVDEETRACYEALPGPLGERVRQYLRRDEEGDSYLAFSGGRCPMLDGDGLCSLQRSFGQQALSRVCDRYPRFRYEFGALCEEGVSLSCPAACRLILSVPFAIAETVNGDPPSLNDIDPMRYFAFLRGRSVAFRIAEDRRYPVFARAARLLAFSEALEGAVAAPEAVLTAFSGEFTGEPAARKPGDFETLKAVFLSMEPLDPDWPAVLSALRGPASFRDETIAERLLQYYIYKYFLQAAYDGKLLWRMQLAAASLLLLAALCDGAEDEEELVGRIHRFSRETEHSEPNLARFARFAGKRHRRLFAALLG